MLDAANRQTVLLRLFGGMAIRFHCPSATHRGLQRKYADIDFMGLSRQSKRIRNLFSELGYTPREIFNAMQGATRLIYNDVEQGRRIDVFLDVFEMCHKFDFRNRLTVDKPTISLADLLATKLQVVELTNREYRDILALIHDHDLGDADAPETTNGTRIANLCSDDWGVWKTFSINISRVLASLENFELPPQDQDLIRKRLADLQSRINCVPKSTRWKLRAKIGERRKWYELPERDEEVVDSRIVGTPPSSTP